MALQKNIKLKDNFGIEVEIPNVYIKVQQADCSKDKVIIHQQFKKSADGDVIISKTDMCDYDLNGANPIKQAYLHLKSLPEFEGAIDC